MTPTRFLLSSLLLLAAVHCQSSSTLIRPDTGAQAGASDAAGQGGSSLAGQGGSSLAGQGGSSPEAGSAGVSPTGGTAGAAGSAPSTAHCPSTGRGPEMVLLEGPAGPYCLDRTEVTQAHYQAFMASEGTGIVTPTKENQYLFDFAQCATANTRFMPNTSHSGVCHPEMVTGHPDMPIRCVDVCDAHAFCRWSGKRLCGQTGGKPGSEQAASQPASSEWMWACTNGGSTKLPMGDKYTSGTCTDQTVISKDWKSGDRPGCRGQGEPYDQIVDQLGGVAEITAECTEPKEAGAHSTCLIRGGSLGGSPDWLSCAPSEVPSISLLNELTSVGIRCCADAEE